MTEGFALKTLKHHPIFYFVIGGLLGLIVFYIMYGFKVVNPTYDEWIYEKGGDIVQHYIGWQYYRKTDWQFPIGMMEGISSQPISVIYTDSIPLFAVIFKILSPVLPSTFQYMGIWGVFSFFLQGGFGALIIRKFSDNFYICGVGSLFFTTITLLFRRMLGHSALAGQWVLLIAILIWLYSDRISTIQKTVLWICLSMIAVLIHPYFVPMVLCIMCGEILNNFLETKRVLPNILILGGSIIGILGIMYCLGAFATNGSFSAGGLGIYSFNLNAFINPIDAFDSRFLKSHSITQSGQKEGFGYLGLGVLIALFIVCMIIGKNICENGFKGTKEFIKKHCKQILPIILVCSGTLFLAVAPVVTLNAKVLFTIPYPEWLTEKLSIFRASGRFAWITFYAIIIFIIIFLISQIKNKKMLCIILTGCILIQFADLSTKIKEFHIYFTTSKTYSSPLKSEKWNELGQHFKHIVFLPIQPTYLSQTDMYYAFAIYALDYNMDLSSFIISRFDFNELKKESNDISYEFSQNNIDKDTLYILTDSSIALPHNVIYEKIDEYTICYYPY